jgi:hypothetical protein
MEFTKVPVPARTGSGGRTAGPNEFQEIVNGLTVNGDAVAGFVPLADGETSAQLEGRVIRKLVRAGKAHPSGAVSVHRFFEHTADGANLTVWAVPLIVKTRTAPAATDPLAE